MFNSYSVGQDNLLPTGSGTDRSANANGGNPNAAVGLPNPGATVINYRNVTRVHEDDSVL